MQMQRLDKISVRFAPQSARIYETCWNASHLDCGPSAAEAPPLLAAHDDVRLSSLKINGNAFNLFLGVLSFDIARGLQWEDRDTDWDCNCSRNRDRPWLFTRIDTSSQLEFQLPSAELTALRIKWISGRNGGSWQKEYWGIWEQGSPIYYEKVGRLPELYFI